MPLELSSRLLMNPPLARRVSVSVIGVGGASCFVLVLVFAFAACASGDAASWFSPLGGSKNSFTAAPSLFEGRGAWRFRREKLY
jgi:hypothetical protein